MQSDTLKITDGPVAGGWIRPRLGGEFGAVTLQVPSDFEAYARIFHPASDPNGEPVSWADVAKACGTTPHREMQWHAVLGLVDADELRCSYEPGDGSEVKWAGSDPPIGAMDIDTLDALCKILATHTVDPADCFFGLCTIQNWEESFSADELQPLLELPDGRDHIVLAGPLFAVDQITFDWSKTNSIQVAFAVGKDDGPPPELDSCELPWREAPNLIWPADRSWLVASEVDFDSTLIGGSAELIEAIVQSPALEAWQVEPTDSLAADADEINAAKKA
ncbi:MAG TPA: hypothetical protein VH703_06815 [Solirubrobacterales bacterium]